MRVMVLTQPGQAFPMADWLASEGRTVHRVEPLPSGVSATLSMSDVAALSEDPSVAALSVDAGDIAEAEVGN